MLLVVRLDALSDIEAKDRHYRQIGNLLENEKYMQVQYGELFYYYYLRKMFDSGGVAR